MPVPAAPPPAPPPTRPTPATLSAEVERAARENTQAAATRKPVGPRRTAARGTSRMASRSIRTLLVAWDERPAVALLRQHRPELPVTPAEPVCAHGGNARLRRLPLTCPDRLCSPAGVPATPPANRHWPFVIVQEREQPDACRLPASANARLRQPESQGRGSTKRRMAMPEAAAARATAPATPLIPIRHCRRRSPATPGTDRPAGIGQGVQQTRQSLGGRR